MTTNENKRIYLVTGAAGYLGSEVCRQLTARGDRVRAFVLPGDKGAKYVPAEAEIVEGDLCDTASLEKFFAVNPDEESVVLHCASIVALGDENRELVMNVNVQGTRNIIDKCLAHPECKKLVYVGSTGAIPEAKDGTAMREVDKFDATKVVSLYGQSKAMATQLVLDAAKNDGLNACAVLPSGILGPGDYAFGQVTQGLLQQMRGEASIGINGTFNLCDVRDLANGVLLAVENGKKGESYILANEVVSYPEFTKLVAEEGSCKKPLMFLPLWLANGVASVMELGSVITDKKPALTKYMIYNLSRNNNFDAQKARDELGYKTRPFRETVRDEIEWLKSIGKLSA